MLEIEGFLVGVLIHFENGMVQIVLFQIVLLLRTVLAAEKSVLPRRYVVNLFCSVRRRAALLFVSSLDFLTVFSKHINRPLKGCKVLVISIVDDISTLALLGVRDDYAFLKGVKNDLKLLVFL